jgi:hypothetical protein
MKLKVNIEYIGNFRSGTSADYKVVKITGAPTVPVAREGGATPIADQVSPLYDTARVGDIISEAQATELARRVEVTTTQRTGK